MLCVAIAWPCVALLAVLLKASRRLARALPFFAALNLAMRLAAFAKLALLSVALPLLCLTSHYFAFALRNATVRFAAKPLLCVTRHCEAFAVLCATIRCLCFALRGRTELSQAFAWLRLAVQFPLLCVSMLCCAMLRLCYVALLCGTSPVRNLALLCEAFALRGRT
jgi:hypothetical protein